MMIGFDYLIVYLGIFLYNLWVVKEEYDYFCLVNEFGLVIMCEWFLFKVDEGWGMLVVECEWGDELN